MAKSALSILQAVCLLAFFGALLGCPKCPSSPPPPAPTAQALLLSVEHATAVVDAGATCGKGAACESKRLALSAHAAALRLKDAGAVWCEIDSLLHQAEELAASLSVVPRELVELVDLLRWAADQKACNCSAGRA